MASKNNQLARFIIYFLMLFLFVSLIILVWNTVAKEPVPTEMSIPAQPDLPQNDGLQLSMEQRDAYPELYDHFSASDFHKVLAFINGRLKDPPDIPVRFTTCAIPNALYRPGPDEIVMCYELLDAIAKEAAKDKKITKDPLDFTVDATLFIFLHEMGHALINHYDLPITGLEEDAVDQLAVGILAENDQFDALVASALFFKEKRGGGGLFTDKALFSDVHSLDEQRYYNILCWAYGKDPVTYEGAMTKGGLPEGRAKGCKAEYNQLLKSWSTILEPYTNPKVE